MPDSAKTLPVINHNVRAFLDMIAWSEGTKTLLGSDDGYNVIVGGHLFHDYKDHPRQLVRIPSLNLSSTAAGRYQLLARYYDAYKASLHLPDFSPASQDAIAIQQIRERKALDDIVAGRLDVAILKCSNIWASFPGAHYGQHERTYSSLEYEYLLAGGRLQNPVET